MFRELTEWKQGKDMAKHKKYYYKGKMRPVRELSRLPECVVSSKVLGQRIARGYSIRKAMTTPPGKHMPKLIEWKGEQVKLVDLVRDEAVEGVDYSIVKNRLQIGWSIEKALATPRKFIRHEKGRGLYDYFGTKMSVTELAQLPCCAVGAMTLYSRLELLGWDLYDALVLPARYNASEDKLTPEERKKWNVWLATPIEVIRQRAEEFWLREENFKS